MTHKWYRRKKTRSNLLFKIYTLKINYLNAALEKLKRPLQLKNDRIRKKRASHKKYKKVIANAKEKLKRQRNR